MGAKGQIQPSPNPLPAGEGLMAESNTAIGALPINCIRQKQRIKYT